MVQPPMQDTQDHLMTVADVIAAMNISRSSWQKMAATGRTPPIIRIGSLQRIRREAFTTWLKEQEQVA